MASSLSLGSRDQRGPLDAMKFAGGPAFRLALAPPAARFILRGDMNVAAHAGPAFGAPIPLGWGAAPVDGLEKQPGDHVVEKMRMSAWEGTNLETILKATRRDVIINTGAWTNMSVEHTARTGADKGYVMVTPEDSCSTMNAEWHAASIHYALGNVSVVTNTDAVIAALG